MPIFGMYRYKTCCLSGIENCRLFVSSGLANRRLALYSCHLATTGFPHLILKLGDWAAGQLSGGYRTQSSICTRLQNAGHTYRRERARLLPTKSVAPRPTNQISTLGRNDYLAYALKQGNLPYAPHDSTNRLLRVSTTCQCHVPTTC